MNQVVGVDIGGANLKYVSADGVARSRFFPMWSHSEQLASSLTHDLSAFGRTESLAVTMTGELADCFVDRDAGVEHIVSHTTKAALNLGIPRVSFYSVDGCFCDGTFAVQNPDAIAASNWHALANYVGKEIAENALLIDIGSTTTDIIPIVSGKVATDARTDYDRLMQGSLVYVGCRRTPVCALVDQLTLRSNTSSVMNEFFATIDDARVVLGAIDGLPGDCDTADGKPRTAAFAANRLARMIGLDRRTVSIPAAHELAQQVIAAAKSRINTGIEKVRLQPNVQATTTIVLSGHGPDLFDLPAGHNKVSLADVVGDSVSRCAPAYAVAQLLSG